MIAPVPTAAEFTDAEVWTLRERYGELPELEFGEAEMRLARHDRHLTSVPAVAWQDGDCTPLVARAGSGDYRCEFFYRVHQHCGTNIDRFDKPAEDVVNLLQAQADHATERRHGAEDAPAR